MYTDYFGLKDKPFSIAPDPHFLYMSERHREALAHLIFALQTDGGFVLLTGEVGTGKTTICRCLLEQIPENTDIAFVLNPKLTALELLATICDEFGIDYPRQNKSIKIFIDSINQYLLAAHARGHKTVLIIDEAQNLSIDVLEQIRLLTNLETNKQKLLQVIMLGQPELKEMLAKPELRQLTQRISARYHLEPLSPAEVANYIGHRLGVAGVERQLFPAATIRKIYHLSGGIPRVINLLCDRALLGAYVQEKNSVSPKLLARTAKEVFGDTKSRQKKPTDQRSNIWPVMLPWVLLSGVAALAATWLLLNNPTVAVTPQPPAIAEPQPAAIPHAQKTPAGLTWPQDVAITDSLALAHNNLFKLWGYAYPEQKTLPGDYALQNGLRYLTKRGSLGSLRTLNRPAVLKLNNRGQIFYATLSTVTSNSATFICADTVQTISITDLITQWQGEFSLLWQPPAGYQSAVTPGEKGPIVLWVEQQLALLYQRTASNNPKLTLTGLLLDEVKQFQEEQGLNADGIVGPITIIHLNNKLSTSQPQLIMPDEG